MNAPHAAPANKSLRRGACPGLSAPMATGDGLLARLTPAGATIALDAFAGLCAAARKHGNGVIEITSRGSIQVRGLTAASAPLFAADVAALGIEASDGIPVVTDPLAGLDGGGADAPALAADLRKAFAEASFSSRLSAKISIAVDGGGGLHFDALAADVRLRASDAGFHIALGGDAASAVSLGVVPAEHAVECVLRLLETLAKVAPQSRMRDAIVDHGSAPFTSAASQFVTAMPFPATRPAADPLGVHPLSSGNAIGIGLPFGHSDADAFLRLIDASRRTGVAGLRTAPGRALLVLGVSAASVSEFISEARSQGFIVDPHDPRRRVVACAGAPICASGEIPARAIAPAIADVMQSLPEGQIVHISGCAKGCAHPRPAAITIIGRDGRCDIAVDGVPSGSVPVDALPGEIARLVRARGAAR